MPCTTKTNHVSPPETSHLYWICGFLAVAWTDNAVPFAIKQVLTIAPLISQDCLPAELTLEIDPLCGCQNGLSKMEVWMGLAREGKAATAANDLQPEVSSP